MIKHACIRLGREFRGKQLLQKIMMRAVLLLTLLAIEAHDCRDLVQRNIAVCRREMALKPHKSGFFPAHKYAKLMLNFSTLHEAYDDFFRSHKHAKFCSKEIKHENCDFSLKISNFSTQNNTHNELIFNLKIGPGHQAAQYHFHKALNRYAQDNRDSIQLFKFDVHCPLTDKCRFPDGAIYNFPFENDTRSSYPTVILEFEYTHRCLSDAHLYCMEYFRLIPTVQAVILFKFGPRSETDRTFYAVGVLYRRRPRNKYRDFVEDAVSFGTAHIRHGVQIPPAIAAALTGRILAPAPQQRHWQANPWRPEQRLWLTVPAADIYYVAGGRQGRIPRLVFKMSPGAPDFRLDLSDLRLVYWVNHEDPF